MFRFLSYAGENLIHALSQASQYDFIRSMNQLLPYFAQNNQVYLRIYDNNMIHSLL